jgi:hypothetical protein
MYPLHEGHAMPIFPTGWLDTLLGWLCSFYAVGHYLFWVLPRCAWLHYTGRITPRDPAYWRDTHKEGKF